MFPAEAPHAHEALLNAARNQGWGPEAATLLSRLVHRHQHTPAALRTILAVHLANERPRRVLNWLHALTPSHTGLLAVTPTYTGPRYSRPLVRRAFLDVADRIQHMDTAPHDAMCAWMDLVGPDLSPYAYAAGLSAAEANDLHTHARLNPDILHALAHLRGIPMLHPDHPL